MHKFWILHHSEYCDKISLRPTLSCPGHELSLCPAYTHSASCTPITHFVAVHLSALLGHYQNTVAETILALFTAGPQGQEPWCWQLCDCASSELFFLQLGTIANPLVSLMGGARVYSTYDSRFQSIRKGKSQEELKQLDHSQSRAGRMRARTPACLPAACFCLASFPHSHTVHNQDNLHSCAHHLM